MRISVMRSGAVVFGAAVAAMVAAGPVANAATGDTHVQRAASVTIMGDGCTDVPDSYFKANFRPACDAHDACYSSASSTDRLVCDQALRADLKSACDAAYADGTAQHGACYGVSDTYYEGVRRLGKSHYNGSGDPS